MNRRLTYPLPSRPSKAHYDEILACRVFSSSYWDKPAVLRALQSGGWFSPNTSYFFDSRDTALFAKQASAFFESARFEARRAH